MCCFKFYKNIINLILVKSEVWLVSIPPHISHGSHVIITAGKELEITCEWPPLA
jgi:hypothetical protein